MLVKLSLWQRVEIQEMLGSFPLEVENEHGDYKFENYSPIDTLKKMMPRLFISFEDRTGTAGSILKDLVQKHRNSGCKYQQMLKWLTEKVMESPISGGL